MKKKLQLKLDFSINPLQHVDCKKNPKIKNAAYLAHMTHLQKERMEFLKDFDKNPIAAMKALGKHDNSHTISQWNS